MDTQWRLIFRDPKMEMVMEMSIRCLLFKKNHKTFLQNLKLPFRSQLINFLKIILRSKYTYIIINAYYKGICVEIERENIAS